MGKVSNTIWILSVTVTLTLCQKNKGFDPRVESTKCTKGAFLEVGGKKEASYSWALKPNHNASIKCGWAVEGSLDCQVSMKCEIDLKKSGSDCEEGAYVKVSDGVNGVEKFCGKTSFHFRPASDELRSMFMTLIVPGTYQGNGVKCTASCSKAGDPLPKNFEKKKEMRCVCGLQNKDDRIVGGEDALINEYPWQIAIVFPGTRAPSCGGSVINDRYILTATHCFWFDKKRPDQIEVLVHAHTLDMTKKKSAKDVKLGKDGSIRSSGYNLSKKTDEDENTQRFKVVEIINHPNFNEYYDFDIAVLKLDRKINLADADAPTPVCLPPANVFDSFAEKFKNSMLTVVGWGLSAENAGGTTRVLQKLQVPYIDDDTCFQSNPELVTKRMTCAGYMDGTQKDACTGDSGGPLVWQQDNKQFVQTGIVSWGEGCARKGKPGVYAKVTELMQWVLFHTQDAKWCQENK